MKTIRWALLGGSMEVLEYLLPDEQLKKANDIDQVSLISLWEWAIRTTAVQIPQLQYLHNKIKTNVTFDQSVEKYFKNPIKVPSNFESSNDDIPCFDEERTIFLINAGVPLDKLTFMSYPKTKSKMIHSLSCHKYRIKLVEQNLNKLRILNKANKITRAQILWACDQCIERTKPLLIRRPALVWLEPKNNPLVNVKTNHNKPIISHTQSKSTHHKAKLISIGIAIIGLVCYKLLTDSDILSSNDHLQIPIRYSPANSHSISLQ